MERFVTNTGEVGLIVKKKFMSVLFTLVLSISLIEGCGDVAIFSTNDEKAVQAYFPIEYDMEKAVNFTLNKKKLKEINDKIKEQKKKADEYLEKVNEYADKADEASTDEENAEHGAVRIHGQVLSVSIGGVYYDAIQEINCETGELYDTYLLPEQHPEWYTEFIHKAPYGGTHYEALLVVSDAADYGEEFDDFGNSVLEGVFHRLDYGADEYHDKADEYKKKYDKAQRELERLRSERKKLLQPEE